MGIAGTIAQDTTWEGTVNITGATTVVLLVFGEITPKTFAKHNAARIAPYAITAVATDVVTTLDALIHRLVRAEREVDRHFWIDAVTGLLATRDEAQRRALAQHAARRIHAAFRLGTRERHRLVRMLLRRLWPLE